MLIQVIKNKILISCFIFLFGGFILGIGVGLFLPKYFNTNLKNNLSLEFHSGGYKLINPLYECRIDESIGSKEFMGLEENLNDYIGQLISDNKVTAVSVYSRDLNNGPWFGVNEKAAFAPSSLLKLPVMMAYYKKAELDPSILSKKISYSTDPVGLMPQNFLPQAPLEKGKTYTVEQLIEQMIKGSDNVALGLLEENIEGKDIDKVTLDLGIPTANDKTPDNYMNVRDYAALYRVLFNASYLTRSYSEKALELLSQAEFKQGLIDSLPKNITVAHKFGERYFPDGTKQLHDCGIVYYPNHPYLICVMTKGSDFNILSGVIQQVSSQVYKEYVKSYR